MGSPKTGEHDYNRMKYYSALRTRKTRDEGGELDENFLELPEHLIPPNLFIVDFTAIIDGLKDEDGKHSSLTTIFSTWNAMAGTGIVCMPYAY